MAIQVSNLVLFTNLAILLSFWRQSLCVECNKQCQTDWCVGVGKSEFARQVAQARGVPERVTLLGEIELEFLAACAPLRLSKLGGAPSSPHDACCAGGKSEGAIAGSRRVEAAPATLRHALGPGGPSDPSTPPGGA